MWTISTGVCFTTAYTRETNKKTKEKTADVILPVSPKMGLGSNYPILNVYDVVPRVRMINTYN